MKMGNMCCFTAVSKHNTAKKQRVNVVRGIWVIRVFEPNVLGAVESLVLSITSEDKKGMKSL